MAITLREHQVNAANDIEQSWQQNHTNVISVLPTGAGKTILKAEMARRELMRPGGDLIWLFAHRDVLLGQISDALCLMGIEHGFITSQKTKREICDDHVRNYGRSFNNDRARVMVCSVDKMYRMDLSAIAPRVTLWMMDETHHLLDDSKWHKCIDPLVNARGLGVTATPIRADKKGLGRDYDGVFDDMCVGATMHELIQKGMLSPYKIFTPPSKLNTDGLKVTASGDYNQRELAKRTDNREITGDAIEHYKRIAWQKQAIYFTVNIDHGEHVAAEFRKHGVSAVNLSSKTPAAERNDKVRQFKNGQVKVLVNCDLFGEGFDVPSVEVVGMLRKTESYSLFKQQFGRALRVIEGKQYGILIDHVGNVEYFMREFGLNYPHDDPQWTLANTKKRRKGNGEEHVKRNTRVCPKCFARYEVVSLTNLTCPECHHTETEGETIDAELAFQAKQGELVEMNVDFINNLLAERQKIDRDPEALRHYMKNAPSKVRNAAVANHTKRLNAQTILRDKIQRWCERRADTMNPCTPTLVQREFELEFGVNILAAQVLSEREANELAERIKYD